MYGVRVESDIEDVFSDVVVDLMENLDTLPERIEKSFAGFFYWRTRKAIQKRRKKIPLSNASPDSIAEEGDNRRIEDREVIEKCRRTLTETQQRIFELRYIQEMSLDEIARTMDSTVNAVGQNIFRLSRKMRECLAGLLDRS